MAGAMTAAPVQSILCVLWALTARTAAFATLFPAFAHLASRSANVSCPPTVSSATAVIAKPAEPTAGPHVHL